MPPGPCTRLQADAAAAAAYAAHQHGHYAQQHAAGSAGNQRHPAQHTGHGSLWSAAGRCRRVPVKTGACLPIHQKTPAGRPSAARGVLCLQQVLQSPARRRCSGGRLCCARGLCSLRPRPGHLQGVRRRDPPPVALQRREQRGRWRAVWWLVGHGMRLAAVLGLDTMGCAALHRRCIVAKLQVLAAQQMAEEGRTPRSIADWDHAHQP